MCIYYYLNLWTRYAFRLINVYIRIYRILLFWLPKIIAHWKNYHNSQKFNAIFFQSKNKKTKIINEPSDQIIHCWNFCSNSTTQFLFLDQFSILYKIKYFQWKKNNANKRTLATTKKRSRMRIIYIFAFLSDLHPDILWVLVKYIHICR